MRNEKLVVDYIEDGALDVLSDPDFEPIPYRHRHEALAGKLGLDFSAILFAFDHIPLALRGDEHRRRRASLSRTLNDRHKDAASALPEFVERHFSPLASSGLVDVLEVCVNPFVRELLSSIAGTPTDIETTLVSRIFSRNLGISQRRRLEEQLQIARERLEKLHPDDSAERTGERLAMLILGHDALVGTLARSLHNSFEQANGRRLCDTEPMPVPTRTGVPFIDREAVRTTKVGERTYSAGDVVRCQLHTLEKSDEPDFRRFFGKGAHLCLGRSISLAAFREIAKFLATLPVRVRDIEFELRKDDVFLYPEKFRVVVAQ